MKFYILKNKINTFQIQEGRYPNSLDELVEKGYIEKLPEPPEGNEICL
jgi:competence protein ComGC